MFNKRPNQSMTIDKASPDKLNNSLMSRQTRFKSKWIANKKLLIENDKSPLTFRPDTSISHKTKLEMHTSFRNSSQG